MSEADDEFENEKPLDAHWWKPGDVIEWRNPMNGAVARRRIVDVRPTGYGWEYPDRPSSNDDNYWWSENSNDPGLFWWTRSSLQPASEQSTRLAADEARDTRDG